MIVGVLDTDERLDCTLVCSILNVSSVLSYVKSKNPKGFNIIVQPQCQLVPSFALTHFLLSRIPTLCNCKMEVCVSSWKFTLEHYSRLKTIHNPVVQRQIVQLKTPLLQNSIQSLVNRPALLFQHFKELWHGWIYRTDRLFISWNDKNDKSIEIGHPIVIFRLKKTHKIVVIFVLCLSFVWFCWPRSCLSSDLKKSPLKYLRIPFKKKHCHFQQSKFPLSENWWWISVVFDTFFFSKNL